MPGARVSRLNPTIVATLVGIGRRLRVLTDERLRAALTLMHAAPAKPLAAP